MSRRTEGLSIFCFFAVVWSACLATFAIQGDLPGDFAGDTNRAFIPFRAHLMRMFSARNFPDLAPGMFLGQPVMSFGQISPLYPTTLLGLICPVSHHKFFLLDLWVHLTAASAFAAFFIRSRGRSVAAALIAGWIYANSSAVLFRAYGHWTLLHQSPWLPLVLLTWERMGAARQVGHQLIVLTGLLGLMLISHNPQWLFFLMLLLLPMEAVRLYLTRRIVSVPGRMTSYILCGMAAAVLGTVTLGPMLFGLGSSFRTLLAGRDMSAAYDLSPNNLVSIILPYALFGDSPFQFRGKWNAIESTVILGRGAFVLSLTGILVALTRPRLLLRRHALPLCLIGGALLFGAGASMPWFHNLVEHAPLLGSFRAWGRVSVFLVLGLVMFVADGFDSLPNRTLRPGVYTSAGAVLLLIIPAGLLWLIQSEPGTVLSLLFPLSRSVESKLTIVNGLSESLLNDIVWYLLWSIVGLTVWLTAGKRKYHRLVAGTAFMLLAGELFVFQRFVFRERAPVLEPRSVPALSRWLETERERVSLSPYTTAFLAPELINFGMHYEGVRSPTGADVNMRAEYAVWLNEAQGYAPNSYQLDSHVGVITHELIDVTGMSSVVTEKSDSNSGHNLGKYAAMLIRNQTPYAELVDSTRNTTAPGNIKVRTWNDDLVQFEVSAGTNAFLRVREFYDKNWNAWVNGHTEDILASRKNLLIPLKAGRSVVKIQYIDRIARISMIVSLLAWAAYAAAILYKCVGAGSRN